MKRKPLTRKAICQTLTRQVLANCKKTRESTTQAHADEMAGMAFGALELALATDAVDIEIWSRLFKLANSAQYNRSVELIYNQPPYIGAEFAEARHAAAKAAA